MDKNKEHRNQPHEVMGLLDGVRLCIFQREGNSGFLSGRPWHPLWKLSYPYMENTLSLIWYVSTVSLSKVFFSKVSFGLTF